MSLCQAGEREAGCHALLIADRRSGAVLESWPLAAREELIYAYVHSQEGQPAEEWLRLESDAALHLFASRSPQHGAGHLPERSAPRPWRERPGWQEARPPGAALTPFAMFTGAADEGDPRLVWRGHELALARAYPRRHVEWRVERRCR